VGRNASWFLGDSGPLPGGRWKPSAADEAATDWVRA
jgi:hypothetical protein